MKLVKLNNGMHNFPGSKFAMDRFLNEDFLKPFFGDDFQTPTLRNSLFSSTVPSVNVVEHANGFRIEMAAPGLVKDDFKINLEKDLLTISVKKESAEDENTDAYRRREFNYSSFERSFRLPETVDSEKIDAKYENGVLRIALPKKEAAIEKPAREIEIG
jgi:HSP20 family protein